LRDATNEQISPERRKTMAKTNAKTTEPRDLYTPITQAIFSQLEAGVRPWHQPWKVQHAAGGISRPLRSNGEAYHGINVVVLWLTAFEKQYVSPLWVTFQQAKELGGFVRKGEKGTGIVYANSIEKKETDQTTGEEKTERIPFLKSYTVFNAEQVEGLPAKFYATPAHPLPIEQRLEIAERFFAATKADIRHGGNRAYYSPGSDYIQMPPFESFETRESYYSTLAHECTHWTKHETRLNRTFETKRFGDHGYAMEELVAELGAAFVCADLGITPEVLPEHASYLAAWLKVMKADNKAIFTAAAQAERAAEFLQRLHPSEAAAPPSIAT
jgi:antirestriction protein ArdC